jgi:hypothetical protein
LGFRGGLCWVPGVLVVCRWTGGTWPRVMVWWRAQAWKPVGGTGSEPVPPVHLHHDPSPAAPHGRGIAVPGLMRLSGGHAGARPAPLDTIWRPRCARCRAQGPQFLSAAPVRVPLSNTRQRGTRTHTGSTPGDRPRPAETRRRGPRDQHAGADAHPHIEQQNPISGANLSAARFIQGRTSQLHPSPAAFPG